MVALRTLAWLMLLFSAALLVVWSVRYAPAIVLLVVRFGWHRLRPRLAQEATA